MNGLVAQSGPVIPDFGEASDCVQENRLFCPDWVRDNWGDVLQPALLQHVKLTIIAVAVGFVIAFVAALFARRRRWFERPFDLLAALCYTIPSLALFQLLVPITGLTVTTVEVRSSERHVPPQRVGRGAAERHDAFLPALPHDPDDPLLEVDGRLDEPDRL